MIDVPTIHVEVDDVIVSTDVVDVGWKRHVEKSLLSSPSTSDRWFTVSIFDSAVIEVCFGGSNIRAGFEFDDGYVLAPMDMLDSEMTVVDGMVDGYVELASSQTEQQSEDVERLIEHIEGRMEEYNG